MWLPPSLVTEKESKKYGVEKTIFNLKKEILEWLKENIDAQWYHDEYSGDTIMFVEKESAVAFKLRWL